MVGRHGGQIFCGKRGLGPEPRQLPFGVLAGGDGQPLDAGGTVDPTVEQGGDFAPTEDLASGASGHVARRTDFVEGAAGQARFDGGGDAGIQIPAVAREDNTTQSGWRGRFGEDSRGGLAGLQAEFESARDAAGVVDIDRGEAGGVEGPELRKHGLECHSPDLLADRGIDRRKVRESAGEGLQIEPAPADDDREFMARDDARDGLEGALGELRGVHFLGAGHAAEEVMRHAGLVGGGRLCAEHGELAVKLEGIGTDDFAAELFREGERDIRFADGSRAGEEDGVTQNRAIVIHAGKKRTASRAVLLC
jgi:hypothetical protein